MAQKPQIIDITKSYLPGDPNSLVQNLVNTDKEDGEEKTLPVLPYEGYNFLPTAYGYKSFFGTTSNFGVGALPSRAQFILLYQLPNFQSRLIALCEDGIWVCNANVPYSLWVKTITLSYDEEVFQEWTWCVIENVLYMYQQGRSTAWKTYVSSLAVEDWPPSHLLGGSSLLEANARSSAWNVSSVDLTIIPHTPNFLNMEGQMGIFRAGTRLGFWDSANSVSWSSNLDLTDFTPSLENLAGNTIFGAVKGRIVIVRSHGEGFVVYSTKSIVGITFAATGNLLWDGKTILDDIGIRYSKSVCVGIKDTEHYVFSSSGLFQIGTYTSITGSYAIANILPEVNDFLKETRDPIALTLLENRYICFDLISDRYIDGIVSFEEQNVDPLVANIRLSDGYWTGDLSDLNPTTSNQLHTIFDVVMKGNTGFATRLNRYWRPRWDSTFQDMQLFAYTHMYSGILHFDFGYPATPEIEDPITVAPIELTSTILTAHEPLKATGTSGSITEYGNPFTLTGCFPGKDFYSSNTSLSIFYKQELEWEEFQANQLATKNRIIGYPYVSNIQGLLDGDTVGYLISGFGPVKLKYERYTTTLRKYFTQRYKITAHIVSAKGIDSKDPVMIQDVNHITLGNPNNTVLSLPPTGLKSYYDWIMELLAANPAFNAVPLVIQTQYQSSSGSGATINYAPGVSFSTALVDLLASYIANYPSYNMNWISFGWEIREYDEYSNLTRVWTSYLYVDFRFSITRVIFYDIDNHYLYSPGQVSKLGSAVSTQAPTFGNLPKLNYTVSTETGEYGYSDLTANQTHWDLLDGLGNVLASLRIDAPASAFAAAAAYPNMSGLSLEATHPEIYWHVEDADGNVVRALSPIDTYNGTFGGYPVETGYGIYDIPASVDGIEKGGTYVFPVTLEVTYPGVNFLLQEGAITPLYQDFLGFLVLDLHLKKWGKAKVAHKLLLDLIPANSDNTSVVTYESLGITAACLDSEGNIIPFDDQDVDGYIRYGKVGYQRLGMTWFGEVRLQFRKPYTGDIILDASLDGKALVPSLRYTETFTEVYEALLFADISARWITVSISGSYDLTGLEVRGTLAGRR